MSEEASEMLEGQVAVVTGAGRGMGRAIAEDLARRGMRVALLARSRPELEDLAGRIGPTSGTFPVDVRRTGPMIETLKAVHDRMGPVRVLVNAAGVYHHGLVTETGDDDFERVVDTNLKGVFTACRLVLPEMMDHGVGDIVNISSIAGKIGTPRRALYSASKFGVVGFSQALAEEVREYGIRVAVLCPGSTNTRFSPKDREGKDPERMLQPEDVAQAVGMVLLQPPGSFISEIIMRPTRKP